MNLAILIATRNRPKMLGKLLHSLVQGTSQPQQVIIVSSGEEICSAISTYREQLNINHIHISEHGQIRQKMIGIEYILEDIDWVLFSDDDITFEHDTIERIQSTTEKCMSELYVGIGVNNIELKQKRISKLKLSFLTFLGISSRVPGDILKSGIVTSYAQENSTTRVRWLNGCSIWRTDIARKYRFEFLDSKYSAYEDVIFSQYASKFGNLIFEPSIKVKEQLSDRENLEFPEIVRFKSNAFWRLYFVLKTKELSRCAFVYSHVVLTILFMYKKIRIRQLSESDLVLLVKICIDLSIAAFSCRSEDELIKLRGSKYF